MTYVKVDGEEDDSLHLHTIEQACLRFEAAWTQGQRPALVEYLCDLSGEARRRALCDLLWIEWDHLRRLGTPPNLDEYRARFAELSDSVDEAWRSDFRRFASESEATQIRGGRYTIVKPHACGGLGQVYIAHDEELGRQVALKEIQGRHAKSQSIQERLVREAKITGKLEHSGIVPVYSVGRNPDGTPYYTMRFVQGESLKAAIDEFHSRTPAAFYSRAFRQLLSRFVSVCNVMEYVHSRGVLHRDLKPGNIMLGKHDETLVVDWGLAKEAGQAESCGSINGEDSSLTNMSFTTHGALIGTPCYMSPEQAAGKLGDLTAASDIYSLGATLYHLLVGQAPLAKVPRDTLLTRVQRGDIPTARSLQPAVPRPLDAICANAMSQDPADRYESAAALADDLGRWLADDVVTAYAEPLPARTARWARRHQTAMASGIIAILLVAVASAGIAVLIAFNNRLLSAARSDAEEKRIAAVASQATAEKARLEAEIERDLSKSIAEFMVKCFRSPDPEVDGNTITVADILDRSFEDIKDNADIAPLTKARLLEALADSNLGLGLYSRAVNVAEYSWDYCQKHLNPDHEQMLAMQSVLAGAYLEDGQTAKAVALFEEVVDKSISRFGNSNPLALSRQQALANALDRAGRLDEAFRLGQASLEVATREFGPEHKLTLAAEYSFALLLLDRGDFDDAIKIFQKVLEREQRELRNGHPDILASQNSLASAYEAAGRYDEAISLQKSILELRTSQLGPQHPYTLNTQNNLANTFQSAGNYVEAIVLHKNTLELRERQLGKNHPSTLRSMSRLAGVYADAGRLDDAIPLLRRTLDVQSRLFGEDDTDFLIASKRLGSALLLAGDIQQAIPILEQCLSKLEQKFGKRHQAVSSTMSILAQAYRRTGRAKDSVAIYRELVRTATDSLGANHPENLTLQNNLATALATASQLDEAVLVYSNTLRLSVEKLGAQHPHTLQRKVNLAVCFQRLGKPNLALPLLESARTQTIEALGWGHPLTLQSHLGLAASYDELGRPTESVTTYESLIDQLNVHLGPEHVSTITAKRFLAGSFSREGKYAEAVACMEPVVSALRERLGRDNVQTLEATLELASILRMADRYVDAETYYRELVEVVGKQKQHDELENASNLYWLGICQIKQDRYSDAEASLRQCWEIRQRLLAGDWTTAIAESVLGQSLARQRKFDVAEKHLIKGFESVQMLRDTIPADVHEQVVVQATERLVELYELWGKLDDAEAWRKELSMNVVSSKVEHTEVFAK